MAIFLGTRGEDVLAWRGVADLVAELRGMTAERMTSLLSDEAVALHKAFAGRLEEEIALEERFAVEFGRTMDNLERARFEDEFSPLLSRFNQLVKDYFRERGSVIAVHSLCNAYRDALVRKALLWTEAALEIDEMRKPPAPYCLLESGSAGRLEQTFCVDPAFYLIYGESEDDAAGYFNKFVYRAAAMFGKIGLLPDIGGAAMMKSLWLGGRTEWRQENLAKLQPAGQKGLSLLLGRADLRLVHGDEGLAEEMMRVVRSLIDFRRSEFRDTTAEAASSRLTRAAISFPAPGLRDLGKSITETPTGLDFFGRLKVEKGGRHRGRFDLEQYALAPLITNVRMLALEFGVAVTGTIARIKELQGAGRLSVELADRLVRAYHEFTRLKVLHQIAEGCESERTCYIDPRTLTEEGDQRLRGGLESVGDLEKITYLSFMEQG